MTKDGIEQLVQRAVVANLDGCELLMSFTIDQLAAGYNGIGPAFLPQAARDKVSKYLDLFAPAALIHDMRYQESDGTRKGFNFANMEFRDNCLKLADFAYPWWNWRRYRARAVALALFDAVESPAGWLAWKPAACLLVALALALSGCRSGAPKAKDANLRGMYANTATETVAIGSAKITVLPDSLESFVAHYSEDTAFLNPSEKTRFLDIYMTGTNCTAAASNVISTVCQAFTAVATTDGKKEEE